MTMPASTSNTTAGSRRRCSRSSVSGTANATAAIISSPVNVAGVTMADSFEGRQEDAICWEGHSCGKNQAIRRYATHEQRQQSRMGRAVYARPVACAMPGAEQYTLMYPNVYHDRWQVAERPLEKSLSTTLPGIMLP